MLGSQVISDARKELIETAAAFYSDAELLRLLNRGELDFVQKTRILEDTAQLSLVEGRIEYPLPSNWLADKAMFLRINLGGGKVEWKRIHATTIEKVSQMTPNFLNTATENRGKPTRAFIWGRSLWLNKAPSAEYATTIYLFFKSKPTALTSASQSINLDDSLAEYLTAYILWKAWKKEKETELAAEQETLYMQGVAEGRKFVKKQKGDMRNRIDIDSPVGFDGEDGF